MSNRPIVDHHEKATVLDDRYAVMRDDYRRTAFAYGRKKIEEILKQSLAEIPSGGRVLDVGCGTGEQMRFCRDLGFDVTGVEPAANMRAIANQRSPELPVLDGVATELPFEDAQFDFVLAVELFRYLDPDDVEKAYQELVRVTKPGGRMFIVNVNRYSLDGFYFYDALHRLAAKILRRQEPLHCDFTTPKQVRSYLQKSGIEDVRFYGCMFSLMRIPYKLHPRLGASVAKLVEPLDDYVSGKAWSVPFAGHLIAVATR